MTSLVNKVEKHYLLFSLGCNVSKDSALALVLKSFDERLIIHRQTELLETEAIDFPFPSDTFANMVFFAETTMTKEELETYFFMLETLCGRTEEQRQTRPQEIPMDLDIVLWDGELVKAKDLTRPYIQDAIKTFSLDLEAWGDFVNSL